MTVPIAASRPSGLPRADIAHGRAGGTRRAILDVSLELFADQGYGGTSLRQISDRLRITKAAIYHHFKAKEDIARAVVEEAVAFFGQIADRLAVAGTDPAGWQRALDQVIDMAIADRQLLLVWDRNEQVFHALFGDDPDLGPRIAQQGEQTAGLFGNTSLSAAERVRLGCVVSGLMRLDAWRARIPGSKVPTCAILGAHGCAAGIHRGLQARAMEILPGVPRPPGRARAATQPESAGLELVTDQEA